MFRKIGVRVELVRSTFIRGEIYGEFDIETAAEQSLARNGQPALRNGPRNPSDGICLFLLRLRLSEDRGAWEVTAEFRAIDADLDGLAKMDQAHANQTVLDMLGALSIMAPLSASATNLSPAAGAVVALGSIAVGASDLIHTHSLILRGGELKVSDGIVGADGTTTVADSGTQLERPARPGDRIQLRPRDRPGRSGASGHDALQGDRRAVAVGHGHRASSTCRCRSSTRAAATPSTCLPAH